MRPTYEKTADSDASILMACYFGQPMTLHWEFLIQDQRYVTSRSIDPKICKMKSTITLSSYVLLFKVFCHLLIEKVSFRKYTKKFTVCHCYNYPLNKLDLLGPKWWPSYKNWMIMNQMTIPVHWLWYLIPKYYGLKNTIFILMCGMIHKGARIA